MAAGSNAENKDAHWSMLTSRRAVNGQSQLLCAAGARQRIQQLAGKLGAQLYDRHFWQKCSSKQLRSKLDSRLCCRNMRPRLQQLAVMLGGSSAYLGLLA